ncbi:hypothetical protein BGZ89_001950 [Linnemannia elongata]|nr:hypothetical protein BGZ89_001950 [Linnemannia elongata]
MSIIEYVLSYPSLKWLDKTTRDGAIKKLKVIIQFVVWQQFKYSVCSAKDTFRQQPLTVDKNSMGMVPTTVTAYYSPSFKSINFPAGVLPLLFFNVEDPELVYSFVVRFQKNVCKIWH